jgi:hypothetical protein
MKRVHTVASRHVPGLRLEAEPAALGELGDAAATDDQRAQGHAIRWLSHLPSKQQRGRACSCSLGAVPLIVRTGSEVAVGEGSCRLLRSSRCTSVA